MRLTDKGIIRRLAYDDPKERIVIIPLLFPYAQLGSVAIDVHLGTEFRILEPSAEECFDPKMSELKFRHFSRSSRKTRKSHPNQAFILHPNELVLASTLEWVRVPENLVARLDGRSSWARLGLTVHFTAGDIQPGSYGMITFELQTDGGVPFKLYPGMRIAQLQFYTLEDVPAESYKMKGKARFRGQLGPSMGPYPDDLELEILRDAS